MNSMIAMEMRLAWKISGRLLVKIHWYCHRPVAWALLLVCVLTIGFLQNYSTLKHYSQQDHINCKATMWICRWKRYKIFFSIFLSQPQPFFSRTINISNDPTLILDIIGRRRRKTDILSFVYRKEVLSETRKCNILCGWEETVISFFIQIINTWEKLSIFFSVNGLLGPSHTQKWYG